MIVSANRIRAALIAAGEPVDKPEQQPDLPEPRYLVDEPRRPVGVIDIDLGIGRLQAGWDNIHRHAYVWHGDAPPPAPDQPRTSPAKQGCPSEGQYRRHLKAGEKCPACRAHVLRLEQQRRRRQAGRRAAR